MTDAGDTLRDIQKTISAIIADVELDQLPPGIPAQVLGDRSSRIADRRYRTTPLILTAGGVIAGLAAFLAYTTKNATLPELGSSTPAQLPHVRKEANHYISGVSEPSARASPSPLSRPHTGMQLARSRVHTLRASPAGEGLAQGSLARDVAIVGDFLKDGSQQGVGAVHLSGKALEDALAEDRLITQRLNNAALSDLKGTR
jgi:hypothetical protein